MNGLTDCCVELDMVCVGVWAQDLEGVERDGIGPLNGTVLEVLGVRLDELAELV